VGNVLRKNEPAPLTLSLAAAARALGKSRWTLARWEANRTTTGFPQRVRLTDRSAGYVLSELEAWVKASQRGMSLTGGRTVLEVLHDGE
jgi:predicted DNA-binding transcriptional regulator AlpA